MEFEAEEWKDITQHYAVSNYGRVFSALNKIILRQSLDGWGYPCVTIERYGIKGTVKVHILVAQMFCSKPTNATEVNHDDGDKTNNYYKNLIWCTHQQNVQHAYDKGLMPKGQDKPLAKLTNEHVEQIKLMLAAGKADPEIAKQFNVHNASINLIRKLKSWKHIRPDLTFPFNSPGKAGASKGTDRGVKLNAADIPQIRLLHLARHSYREIGNAFGVAAKTIESVILGKSWKNY
jgi:hypothetical protein